ncbi:hypothetical protein KPH14_004166 [Odynerus spinipes]|uniref:Uncharacterized protein n=1 Tax=Odynerus spinipes TaxID=1348599 RepID=A0AAD9VV92_9HYME|nr:hypothetical protein KPH14_004166 [Odynerus spinipes]
MSHLHRIVPLTKITEVDENSPQKSQPGSTKIISPISTIIRDLKKSSISPCEYSNSDHDGSELHLGAPKILSSNLETEQR